MKKHYKKLKSEYTFNRWRGEWYWEDWGVGRYDLRWNGYYRYVKTFNEIKQNSHAQEDGYRVRGKRNKLPTVYDDINIGRTWRRSWKDFTKNKKQYIK